MLLLADRMHACQRDRDGKRERMGGKSRGRFGGMGNKRGVDGGGKDRSQA